MPLIYVLAFSLLLVLASIVSWLIGRVGRLEKRVSDIEWELLRHRHE